MEELIQEAKKAGVKNEEQFEAFVELKEQYADDAESIFKKALKYHYGAAPFSTAVSLAITEYLNGDLDYEDDWDDIDSDDEYD